jgi:hypothetical protein
LERLDSEVACAWVVTYDDDGGFVALEFEDPCPEPFAKRLTRAYARSRLAPADGAEGPFEVAGAVDFILDPDHIEIHKSYVPGRDDIPWAQPPEPFIPPSAWTAGVTYAECEVDADYGPDGTLARIAFDDACAPDFRASLREAYRAARMEPSASGVHVSEKRIFRDLDPYAPLRDVDGSFMVGVVIAPKDDTGPSAVAALWRFSYLWNVLETLEMPVRGLVGFESDLRGFANPALHAALLVGVARRVGAVELGSWSGVGASARTKEANRGTAGWVP